ncbi:MAG: HAD family phosphatase [Erysipelotrichaceae bacterium]|nr:HAD family phosphatase [Erysipelotrichaceae bacterium]
MIKNIIFDMGRVLVEFYPEDFLTKEGITDKEERELLLREIFHHEDWTNMDAGIMTEQEMYDEAVKRIPEHLHQTAHNLIFDWNDPIIPVKGMEDFVRECKEKGYGIYLLSNASVAQPVYWLRIPGHQYFDGTVVSALEKVMKPDVRIYQILLDRYGLKAEECLFIDDVQRNIAGAEKAGIRGYLFDGNVDKLRKYMGDL